MLTNGSRYYFGLTAAALLAAIVYAFTVHPADLGGVALLGAAIAAALLGAAALFTRDGEAATKDEAVEAARPAPGASLWPIVFALGTAATVLGLATVPAVFILGVSLLVAGGVEWTIQDWADRASADGRFNTFVRERAIGALEYPGLAALVAGTIAYPFSRIMLAVSKEGAAVIFIVIAAAILTVGFLVAFRPSLRGKALTLIVSVGLTAVVVGGVVSGVVGERAELAEASKMDHYSAAHKECGAEAGEHWDKNANNSVSLRSGVIATVTVEDGKLYAQAIGLSAKLDTITIPRSNAVGVLFRNRDAEDRRLVANLGTQAVGTTGVVEDVQDCTQLTGENQENILLLNITRQAEPGKPYTLTVPGVTGTVTVVVP